MSLQVVTVYSVNAQHSREIRNLLKENGIKARVRLGSNRFYILIDAGSNTVNKQAIDIVLKSGKYQMPDAWKEAYDRDILTTNVMIERIKP